MYKYFHSVAVAMFFMTALMMAGQATAQEKQVNINTASVADLTALKGVGEAKAKAIVEHREKAGPFKSVDDLAEVKGIGPKLLEQIRPQVTVGAMAANAPAAPAGAAAAAGAKH